MEKNKLTLVCTTLGNRPELLQRMLDTAIGFDRKTIHINSGSVCLDDAIIVCPNNMTITDSYNFLIENFVNTEWICCMCDDDYFYPEALNKMITEIKFGIKGDVAHFKFHISGYRPPQDIRGWFFGKEYELCEKRPVTPSLLSRHNRLPAASFFRKSAWEKVGGFQGDKFHDWDLWKRMSQANCTFKFFDYLVYNHVRRENSAWCKQSKF